MSKKNLIVISVGLGLFFVLFSGCGERSGEKEYTKAMKLWQDGALPRARTVLEKSIRKLSENEKKSIAYNQLGIILWRLQEPEKAIEAFNQSCALTEELTGANLNMGIALFHSGKLDEAEISLNNVLSVDPKNSIAQSTLGLIAMRRKSWEKATQDITAAVRINPRDIAAHNALALADLHSGQNTENTITRLQQIAKANPDYAPAAYNLAVVNDRWLGNKSAALSWYRQYLKIAAQDSRIETAKTAISRLTGQGQASAEQHNSSDATRLIAEGYKLHSERKFEAAAKQYQLAIQADPSQKRAHYFQGLSYHELKNYDEAVSSFSNALRIDPNDTNARYMLTLSYCEQRNWSKAATEARTLKKLDQERGEAMLKYISAARQ